MPLWSEVYIKKGNLFYKCFSIINYARYSYFYNLCGPKNQHCCVLCQNASHIIKKTRPFAYCSAFHSLVVGQSLLAQANLYFFLQINSLSPTVNECGDHSTSIEHKSPSEIMMVTRYSTDQNISNWTPYSIKHCYRPKHINVETAHSCYVMLGLLPNQIFRGYY